MKMKRIIAACLFAVVACLFVGFSGCGRSPTSAAPPVPEPATVVPGELIRSEISRSTTQLGQIVIPVEVEADIYFADILKPVRGIVRLEPGTWLVPEPLFTISTGTGVQCDDTICEIIQ